MNPAAQAQQQDLPKVEPTSPATSGAPVTPTTPVLCLCGAAARVGGRMLWSGVDLEVQTGEFVAVLGPNGVGKSTLVKVLLGTVPAAAGEIRVLGRRPGEAGHRVGYLPQRRSFDPDLRIRGIDIVQMGLDGDRWGVPLHWSRSRRAEQARVDEVIELFGASPHADRPSTRSRTASTASCTSPRAARSAARRAR